MATFRRKGVFMSTVCADAKDDVEPFFAYINGSAFTKHN